MKVGLPTMTIVGALIGFSIAAFAAPDQDSDGIPDVLDKCMADSRNAVSTCDTDQDGYGNVCDGDFNQNGMVTASLDYEMIFVPDILVGQDSGHGTDMNCTLGVQATDLTMFFAPQFRTTGKPGPSGLACAGVVPCN